MTKGNVIKGVRLWYVMDGPEIISKHPTQEAAAKACVTRQRELARQRRRQQDEQRRLKRLSAPEANA